MGDLAQQARGYLESAGFKIVLQQDECLIADKLVFGQERDTWIVWTAIGGGDASKNESMLRSSISKVRPNYPEARAYVIAQSRGGFTRDFQQMLTNQRVRFLVPVQFFDTAFKVEEAPRAASAIADIRSLEILQRRVPQPYEAHEPTGGLTQGADLLDMLIDELADEESSAVHVVVGRAGIGKSFLFRALFARLYDEFLRAKASLVLRSRPIPLLPQHMKDIYALRTELLIDNFLRTDVASPVARETFEWLLVNCFATWLLDGLDELYAGDPSFFEYVADLVTRKGSTAKIVIWCRDSLLTTSEAFAEFHDLCAGSTMLRIYKLSEWGRPSKRVFAWLRTEGRPPKPAEQDTPRVASFLRQVESSTVLQSLSGLPFYCEVLLDQVREGEAQTYGDDVMFLNHVVDRMVAREINKGLLDVRLFVQNGLEDWLEQIAVNYVEGRRYSDIGRDEAIEYGKLVLREGVDEPTEAHILTSLLQFPLFKAGVETGRIAFAHDLIAEVLAARSYLRGLRQRVGNVGVRLSRVDLEDPTLLRFMARGLGADEERGLVEELHQTGGEDKSFAALLSLLMLAQPGRDVVKRTQLTFESRNLSGVRFINRDLSGVSFRQSDLSHVMFQDCDLRGALFEGAFLHRTYFASRNDLRDARFGDSSRAYSIFVDSKLFEDPGQIKEWLATQTGRPVPTAESCPTALQLRFLFGKYITPLGTPKRDYLNRDALVAGRQYAGAARPDACLDEAVSEGYLTGPDFRNRFRRAEGDKYAEIVRLVRDGSISDHLGQIIARLCQRRACLHEIHV